MTRRCATILSLSSSTCSSPFEAVNWRYGRIGMVYQEQAPPFVALLEDSLAKLASNGKCACGAARSSLHRRLDNPWMITVQTV